VSGTGFRPPVTLRGRHVELVPLERSQIPGLARAGQDPAVWQFLRIGPGRTEAEMTAFVDEMLGLQSAGSILPFTVLGLSDRVPVGFFRYLDIDRENRSVESGTWLTPSVWRTPVNTEVKYLALEYAFETEEYHRVQLRTDLRNERSQKAIERLGGVREGVHREHFRRPDGTYRTSIVYSILASEWPGVKHRLEEKLARPWPGAPPDSATGSAL
jgi:N-acetyltransferase